MRKFLQFVILGILISYKTFADIYVWQSNSGSFHQSENWKNLTHPFKKEIPSFNDEVIIENNQSFPLNISINQEVKVKSITIKGNGPINLISFNRQKIVCNLFNNQTSSNFHLFGIDKIYTETEANQLIISDTYRNSAETNIHKPQSLTITFVNSKNVTCGGVCDGMFIVKATTDCLAGKYAVNFIGDQGTNVLHNNINSGTADTLKNLCKNGESFIIIFYECGDFNTPYTDGNTYQIAGPSPIVLFFNPASPTVSCPGVCNGTFNFITVAGGNTPISSYTYSWSSGETTKIPTALCAGKNYVITTDTKGCTKLDSVIVQSPVPISKTITTTNVTCSGLCDGAASVNATGGTGMLNYSWYNSSGTLLSTGTSLSGLCVGTYALLIKDNNNCKDSSTFTINIPNPLTATSTKTDASCYGICDGTITLTIAGGTAPYSVSSTPALSFNVTGSTASASAVCSNSYSMIVTDNKGCQFTLNDTIKQPDKIIITPTATHSAYCVGGSSTLTATSSNSNLIYSWSGGITTPTTGSTVNTSVTTTTTFTVTGTNTLNGCTKDTTITVTVYPLPVITVNPPSPSVCLGSSISLTANGAGVVSYSWTPGTGLSSTSGATVLASPISFTTYTVFGTDGNGCTGNTTVMVTVNPKPNVNVNPANAISCALAPVNFSASGLSSGTYSWSSGSGSISGSPGQNVTVTPVASTVVTVVGTDANGCKDTATAILTVQPLPNISASASPNTICQNTSTSLSGFGAGMGGTYSWTNGVSTIGTNNPQIAFPSTTTTYTVYGTDINGCTNTATVTVNVISKPNITVSATTPICVGQNTTATASGGVSYNWYDSFGNNISTSSSVTITPLSTTTLTVVGSNLSGCNNTVFQTIVVNPLPPISGTANPNHICSGSSTTLTGSGAGMGATYTWTSGSFNLSSNSPITVSPSTTTTYTVTASDANGCSNSSTVTVNVNPPLVVSPANPTICAGSSSTLTASGAVTYTWFDDNNIQIGTGPTITVSPITTTTYTVQGTDINGCTGSKTVTVTVNPFLPLTMPNDTAICIGNTANLTANSSGIGVTYTWTGVAMSPASGISQTISVNPVPAGNYTYTVVATDVNGCSSSGSTIVTVLKLPTVTAPASQSVCLGSSVTLTASGAITYSWFTSPGGVFQGTGSPIVSPSSSTIYSVVGIDANGCKNSANTSVIVNSLPNANAGGDQSICLGNSTTLNASGGINYSWVPATGLNNPLISNPIAAPTSTTNYTVFVTDGNGCSDTATMQLIVSTITVAANANNGLICLGDSTILLSSPAGAVSYNWSPATGLSNPNIANPTASPSTSTIYTVQITDGSGCIGTDTVKVVVYDVSASSVVTSPSACGVSDGSVDITVLSGVGPYSFSWTNGATTEDLINVPAGSYNLVITDSKGCTKNMTVNISNTSSIDLSNSTVQNVSSCGGNDGAINLVAIGVSGSETYSWNTGATTASISGLSAGNYTVTVTDAPCVAAQTFTINEPTPIAPDAGNDTIICSGSAFLLNGNLNGGSNPVWTPGGAGNGITVNPTNTTIYILTVTDANNCIATDSKTVTVNALPTINAGSDINACEGSNINLNASGAINYSWITTGTLSSTTIANPVAINVNGVTQYTVIGSDANGCVNTDTLTIYTNPITITGTVTDASICGVSDGSIDITVSGGFNPINYNWSNFQITEDISGLGVGVYTVTVSDAAGCSKSQAFAVNEPTTFILLETHQNTSSCSGSSNDGSINLSVNGGNPPFNFSWTGPSGFTATTEDITNLSPGQYDVIVTDGTGCSAALSVNISAPIPTTVLAGANQTICSGSNTILNANPSGAGTYSWVGNNITSGQFTASATVAPSVTSTYTVYLTDVNNCVTSSSVTVFVNTVDIVLTPTHLSVCGGNDGKILVSVSNASFPITNYSWVPNTGSGGSNNTGLTAGTYTVFVTDAIGCTNNASTSINDPSTINFNGTVINSPTTCGGSDGSISVAVNGGTAPYTYSWFSSGLSGPNVSGLSSGSYGLMVTDQLNCSASNIFTVTDPAPVGIADAGPDVSICSNQQVYFNANTSNILNYNWTTNTGTIIISGNTSPMPVVTANTTSVFTLVTTDVINCKDTDYVSLFVNPNPSINASTTSSPSCSGNPFTLTVTGATTYSWYPATGLSSTADSITSATVSSTTTYTVIGVSSYGCTDTATVTIVPSQVFSLSATVVNPTACGTSDGVINLTVSGGSGSYSYSWTPGGQTTEDISGLSGGVYTVTVTDNNTGCSDTLIAVLNPTSTLSLSGSVTNAITCGGSGFIDISVTGGSAPYTYMWSNGATTEDITAVVGTYFITVTDVNGCTQSGAYTINAPIPLQVNAGNDQTICPGQTTNLSASGTISYSWISGGTFTPSANVASPTVQPFITTNYIVAGTDHNNCISYDTVTVFVKAMILSASTTNISTCGGNDGAINLTVVGGNFPYTYSWSNGATQEDLIGNLTAGSYQCIVTDIIGCKDTIAVTLSDPASFSINATANNPSSCGGNDGSISLNIIGNPLNPVTAVNGIQGAPLTSLPAGFYNITVTDANNCTAAVGVTLSSPIPTQIYAGADTFYCSGSSLQLNASTNGIVSYSWTSSGTLSCTLCPNPIVNPSTTTVYTVFGTDNNGCVSSDQVSVTPSTLTLTVSSTNTTQCGTNTGTLTALVSGSTGAVTYTWSAGPNPNASFQTGVAPGIYTVQVHDLISGCLASGTATIQDPVNFQVSVSLTQPSTCGGTDGSLTANVTTGGSYLFSWNGVAGNATLANVSAGIYQLTVKDALGCAFVKSDTLTDPIPTKPNAGTDQFLCAGTSYTITVTGGTFTSAQWTPSTGLSSATILNPVATPTSSVTYTLITVDNKNCTSYDTISFTVSNLQTSTAVTNNVICGANNASIDLTVTGGIPPLTHLWNTGATTEDISNLTAGIYIDTIIDAIGCIDTVVVVISDPVTFTETLTVTPITQCGATGSVNVTIAGATPPVTFTLNGNNVIMPQTNLSPGNYALLIQDGSGCTKSDFFTLTNPDTNYVIANSDITACYGTNGLQLGATAPVSGSYQWSPATGLSQTNIPNPTITFIDTTIAYVVTFTDAANCVYRDTQVVYSIKIDTISTNTLPATDCFASNGSITINAAGGISPITYNWNTGLSGASISGLSAGTYSVTITESSTLNCSRTFTFSVQSQLPLITLAGNDTTLCSGDSIKLEATGAITYTWSLLNGTLIGLNNPINVLPITGNTTYIVTGALGYCTDSDTVTITLLSSPTAEAGPDVQILEGNPELIGGSPTGPTNVTYSWYPIDGLSDPTSANPKANPKQTTVYYVVVQDNFGCKGIDSVKVIVYLGIIVPSGFTPNGDGSNDKWIIDFIYKYPKAIVQVYNRWGQKLYESAPGYPEPWDGKYNGQDLPVGTYYYVIDLKDDTIKPYTGPITIMR